MPTTTWIQNNISFQIGYNARGARLPILVLQPDSGGGKKSSSQSPTVPVPSFKSVTSKSTDSSNSSQAAVSHSSDKININLKRQRRQDNCKLKAPIKKATSTTVRTDDQSDDADADDGDDDDDEAYEEAFNSYLVNGHCKRFLQQFVPPAAVYENAFDLPLSDDEQAGSSKKNKRKKPKRTFSPTDNDVTPIDQKSALEIVQRTVWYWMPPDLHVSLLLFTLLHIIINVVLTAQKCH